MSTENTHEEDHQIDVEWILHDAIDTVFKFLHPRDLCNVAKVCRSWREAALREAIKRCYIIQLRLAYDFEKLSMPEQEPPNLATSH